jgi:tetratricopeptide (TPR) repeat protein
VRLRLCLVLLLVGCDPPPAPPPPPPPPPAPPAPVQEDPAAVLKRARAALGAGNGSWADLDRELTAAIERARPDPELHATRADVRERMGREDEAYADYKRAVDLASDRPEFRRRRLRLTEKFGSTGEVATELEFIVAAWPDDLDLRLRKARALARDGRHQDALADFSLVLDKRPDDDPLWLERAACAIEAKDRERAVADITHLIARKPTADLYALRGDYQARFSFFIEAEADFRRGLEHDDSHPSALVGLTRIRIHTGRSDEALPLAERLIEVKPSGLAYLLRGEAYVHLQRWEDPYCPDPRTELARRDLAKAVELDPSLADVAKDLLRRVKP